MGEVVSANTAVGAGDRTREHIPASDLFPILHDSLHIGPLRVVGHTPDVSGIIDLDLPLREFEDRAVTLRVGYSPVKGRDRATVEIGDIKAEIRCGQHIDHFARRGVVVEHPGDEQSVRDGSLVERVLIIVDSAFAEKGIHDESFLVHSLGDSAVISHSINGAIFRCPVDTVGSLRSLLLDSAGIDIEVCGNRSLPVERPADNI